LTEFLHKYRVFLPVADIFNLLLKSEVIKSAEMGREDRFQAAEKYSEKMWQLQVQLLYWSLHSFHVFLVCFASKITQFKQQHNL